MLKIIKPSEIESVIGTEVGLSDWIKIDQEQINKFAEATLDHQFIHVDPEQAEPIFGSTIAHGFLSLSLCAGIPFSLATHWNFPPESQMGLPFYGRLRE